MKYLLLLLPFFLIASEEAELSNLNALLVLQDHQLAMQKARSALSLYPDSKNICLTAVKIFAKGGSEEEMLFCYRKIAKEHQRDALEEMAWGIIGKGAIGTAPVTRAIALIAAAIGNDARGVELLLASSPDSHRLLRGLVVEFSSHFRDEALQEMVMERLKVEKDITVRVALLRAIGLMLIKDGEKELLSVLENERSLVEEKAAAAASLLDLKETVDLAEIQKLITSNRAQLRCIACELIFRHEKKEGAHLLYPLLTDAHSEVRKAALETIGALRLYEISDAALQDSKPEVAITAAWALMLYDPEKGQEAMKKWLKSPHADERLYAAAALKGAGKYGYPLNWNTFKETDDSFVKLNLGIGLIQEKVDPNLGADAIFDVVMNHKGRLMECDLGRFSAIGPCTVNHKPDIPHYPEAVNQMTRLELLNLLAIQRYPKALDAVLHFLKERPWGVSGAASALLLTEGDEEALVLIRELLKDESEKVQLQAALILALWGRDSESIDTLERLYFKVPVNKKEQIIEALGKIGDFNSIPFLVERLEESNQTLRLIAAAAILQTLYH